MEKIIAWLMSCGYSETEAKAEAEQMILRNRYDGGEMLSREYVIEMILEDIE